MGLPQEQLEMVKQKYENVPVLWIYGRCSIKEAQAMKIYDKK
jgi:hypothetical protein